MERTMELKASTLGSLSDLVDPYGRQARLFPALITIAPAPLLVIAWFPALWTTLGILVSLASSFGLMLLMSQLGRDRGKSREGELYKLWGGKPSVALLRYRDPRIDDHTKARYFDFIHRRLPTLAIPSAADEQTNPEAADKAYESITAWLLTQTRDAKRFSILFRENISYGFRRNLWGLRPFGITISILGASFSTAMIAYKAIAGTAPAPETSVATAAVWMLACIWTFIVNPSWVRLPADAYGAQLLAACDALDGGQETQTRRPSARTKR
jgi:hypothetical protein